MVSRSYWRLILEDFITSSPDFPKADNAVQFRDVKFTHATVAVFESHRVEYLDTRFLLPDSVPSKRIDDRLKIQNLASDCHQEGWVIDMSVSTDKARQILYQEVSQLGTWMSLTLSAR